MTAAQEQPVRFAGYAALFGKRDTGRDVIRAGAFAKSLTDHIGRFPLYWQHRPDMRIGWVERIAEDSRGLRVLATLDKAEGGAAAALRRGAISGLSFGYRVKSYRADGIGRELTELDLFEVSLVTYPMQHGARVHMISPAPAPANPTATIAASSSAIPHER